MMVNRTAGRSSSFFSGPHRFAKLSFLSSLLRWKQPLAAALSESSASSNPISLMFLLQLLLLLLNSPPSVTSHREKPLAKLSEVSTGNKLRNRRNRATEEARQANGEGRVMKGEETFSEATGEGGAGRETGGGGMLAPSRARHGKPQLGYLQYCA